MGCVPLRTTLIAGVVHGDLMRIPLLAVLLWIPSLSHASEKQLAPPLGVTNLGLTKDLQAVRVYTSDLTSLAGVLDFSNVTLHRTHFYLQLNNGTRGPAEATMIGGRPLAETETHVRVALTMHPWAWTPQLWIRKEKIVPGALQDFEAFKATGGQSHLVPPTPWLQNGPISVLNNPNGETVGTLEEQESESTQSVLFLSTDEAPLRALTVRGEDTMEIDYQVPGLLYFARRQDPSGQDFVQVLPHSAGPEGGLWLRVGEGGTQASSWAAHLANTNGLWWPVTGGFKVHKKANAKSRGRTLPEGHYDLEPLGEHEGDWFKARFIQYDDAFQCGDPGQPTGKTWEGWVPAIEPDGQPAYGTYSRGC
jgi:hypothetical protein